MSMALRLSCSVGKLSKMAQRLPLVRTKGTDSKTSSPVSPLFLQAEKYKGRTALIDQQGHHRYEQLVHRAHKLTSKIHKLGLFNPASVTAAGDANAKKDMSEENPNIAFLCPSNASYVITQWSCWMLGATAVPLSPAHPDKHLRYFLTDSQAKLLIYTEEYAEKVEAAIKDVQIECLELHEEDCVGAESEETCEETLCEVRKKYEEDLQADKFNTRNALIVYTSGTTGVPKGVVHTFGSLDCSIRGMITEWGWSKEDIILHVLPLHHVHGIVNCLMTPLAVGANCVMLPKFHVKAVWDYLLQPASLPLIVTVFMAVPTVYVKLIEEYDRMVQYGEWSEQMIYDVCNEKFRLMVCGSAALPSSVLEKWKKITGHTLLERYGMTETLMALTNPYDNAKRIPGHVGKPFPGVEVCIIGPKEVDDKKEMEAAESDELTIAEPVIIARSDNNVTDLAQGREGAVGELCVRGSCLFKGYYNRPQATEKTYLTIESEDWFETGDTACYDKEADSYRILGRTSVDIISSGGYKISALAIERVLLEHPAILDVAVVGLSDAVYGEKLAAVVATKQDLSLEEIREFGRERLPIYELPTELKVVKEIPRNQMGKVNKKELVKTMFP